MKLIKSIMSAFAIVLATTACAGNSGENKKSNEPTKKENKILVSEGNDKVKNETFYRSIGGGIEFLENSKDALKREFKKELNIEIIGGEF